MDEGTRCEIYEKALNPKIVKMAITRGGWSEVKLLKEKQALVISAATAVSKINMFRSTNNVNLQQQHQNRPVSNHQAQNRSMKNTDSHLSPGVPMEIDNLRLEARFKFAEWRAMCKKRLVCHFCGDQFDSKHQEAKGCIKNQGQQLKTEEKIRIWKEWLGEGVKSEINNTQSSSKEQATLDNIYTAPMSLADMFLDKAICEEMEIEDFTRRDPPEKLSYVNALASHSIIPDNFTRHLTMQKYSERQGILRDLFLMLIFIHHQDTDDLLDSTMNIPTVPSIGQVSAPSNPGCALVLDLLFSEESMVHDSSEILLDSRGQNGEHGPEVSLVSPYASAAPSASSFAPVQPDR
ncbi:hypothetical protein PGTUg99_028652 [Puccinia graminis f. sp. tritici]|uniref:Uncharacterized protein n=1 Tax=Puccinia graminis f. sp. tritici TaxID=56615 RepID=A0A5B0R712_PUCGR|nr:hypothetical protein PGTUg99_028652 [Puccinia graminis f. sp. tritici]